MTLAGLVAALTAAAIFVPAYWFMARAHRAQLAQLAQLRDLRRLNAADLELLKACKAGRAVAFPKVELGPIVSVDAPAPPAVATVVMMDS